MYEIVLSNKAKKQLSKFPKVLRKRMGSVLERMRVRPHHFAKKLSGVPYFSQRVGEYRIIIEIQNKKLIVLVIEIEHRKQVYK